MCGCEIGRDRACQSHLPIAEGLLIAVEGVKQTWYSIQPVEGATKLKSEFRSPGQSDKNRAVSKEILSESFFLAKCRKVTSFVSVSPDNP